MCDLSPLSFFLLFLFFLSNIHIPLVVTPPLSQLPFFSRFILCTLAHVRGENERVREREKNLFLSPSLHCAPEDGRKKFLSSFLRLPSLLLLFFLSRMKFFSVAHIFPILLLLLSSLLFSSLPRAFSSLSFL